MTDRPKQDRILTIGFLLLTVIGVAAAVYLFPRLGQAPASHESDGRAGAATPDRASYQHGLDLERQGQLNEAAKHIQVAIKQNPNEADYYDALGRILINQAHWVEAKGVLERGVRRIPSHARLHFSLGRVHYYLKRAEEAEKSFSQAIALDANFADAYDWLGLTYLLQAASPAGSGLPLDRPKVEAALKEIARAIELNPTNALYQAHAATACESLNDYDRMVTHLEKAVALDEERAELHQQLGDAYAKRNQWNDAEQAYRRALELDPDSASIHHALGQALMRQDKYADARQPLETAVNLDPDEAPYRYSLGTTLMRLGEPERGREELARFEQLRAANRDLDALRLDALARPDNLELALALAVAYKKAGRFNEAALEFRRAIALDQKSEDAYLGLGVLLLEINKLPDAEGQFRRVLSLNPDNLRAQNNLGLVLLRQGKVNEAVEVLEKAAKVKPEAYILSNLGAAYVDAGDLPAAFRTLRRALELDARSAPARINLGRAELNAGNTDRAIEELKQAIQIMPQDAAAHYWLAQAYHKAGQISESQTAMQRFQQLSRTH